MCINQQRHVVSRYWSHHRGYCAVLHLVSLLGKGVKLMVKELMEKGAACKEDRTVETAAEC
jgi:hypothetical protein